ncbi:repressible alkaline phosphatase [Plectosphaerella cucumerina]|uniref:Alkaline phosphatase n=1 Tax=Plectosphaerella cucumerina TaxID=40658 RepID=A0A8K0X438_9PEZI|nr:repressible alkaline phosphatase [Plectosphaerella cucumerina]
MRSSTVLVGAMAQAVFAAVEPKNFIFIVPDGLAPASQTLLRTYLAMANGTSTTRAPVIEGLPMDVTTIGNIRTHSSNNLVTDSAAAGTALASGVKTENGAIGVLPNGQPVGTVLEAAKHAGLKTALVVTSIINHATPAVFSSHVNNRNALAAIAEQQIGYSHPLGQSVDILLGGGRCYFKPQGQAGSCRQDGVDLFSFAEENGYYVAQNRSGFDALESGLGDIRLPYVGLFNDGDLGYDIDRQQQPEADREPSLSEMTIAALNSLHRATHCKDKGYFMMIESSRIDHASHDNDPVSHLHDVLEFNKVADVVMRWIDEHPDTVFLAVGDHETGGITLPSGYNPLPIGKAKHSASYLSSLWSRYSGSDRRGYLVNEILPAYGITDASTSEIDRLLAGSFTSNLVGLQNARTNIKWSTGGHSAVDTILYGYGAGEMGDQIKVQYAGSWDNTQIPRLIEKALGVDIDEITKLLRANGTDWIPRA